MQVVPTCRDGEVYARLTPIFQAKQDRKVVPWDELKEVCWYFVLMRTVLTNQLDSTVKQFSPIAKMLGDGNTDIPLLDRKLKNLTAFVS
jgi:hypothetical protein